MVIIYILPLVLILGSMFYKINYLLVLIIIMPLILILIKKINNLRKKLKW
jgi:large-conductance mechanosensitive channel